ncbi:zinc finger protein jing [Plutella xylostella]|uniref:zinc finger protein jing n=1 Tax=Plutella xylostella TaxID=51655 RepID=UPI0020328860|nr:zinc finger protein jing [Plutella xylostella]
MADGLRECRNEPKQMNNLTFSGPDSRQDDSKKCSEETFDEDDVKLSFYAGLKSSESCGKSFTSGVVAAGAPTDSKKDQVPESAEFNRKDVEDRKKRCFDRYDSSESSDSGVAVSSPTESSGSSDITEPGSPRSPESCDASEEACARMPPWSCEPAPRRAAPAARALPPPPPLHRRITEYFNHKMKPHNHLKRDAANINNDDTKKKCQPKNGVTNELEKYISFLSQTFNPRVLMDVGKQADAASRKNTQINSSDAKGFSNGNVNGLIDYSRPKDGNVKSHPMANGFTDNIQAPETQPKGKMPNGQLNGLKDNKKHGLEMKIAPDPSANGIVYKKVTGPVKRKMPIAASNDLVGLRVTQAKPDSTKSNTNDVVTSTTKLDSKMNGVTCGSNNISLNSIAPKLAPAKRETQKKSAQPTKRTNRKSSACIANSKNLTWSKANNFKQVQLQKQNCVNAVQGSPVKNVPSDPNTTANINIPNGVRQVPMAVNGSLGNLNVPATNFQNCHQLNLQQQCNGTVTSTNLGSFVAMPHHNVMLTTLRIPQNGIPAQSVNPHNNMAAFGRQNVNVSSPTKLNGQIVFPLVQNLNGAVVQIPNFVLPQTSQLTAQRQDHMQNQQAAQILINGTLLKLANTMASPYANVNKTMPPSSQPMPVGTKNVPGMPPVGMTVQPKPNYAVSYSHPMLVSQSGFIVTSVPNMNVKETWSSTSTYSASSTQSSSCGAPMVPTFLGQPLHTSSIPIAPVKPPDNPIQGTDPPSSTVKEPETISDSTTSKCDIPWLSKTVNNNHVPLDSNKFTRPFAQVSKLSQKLPEFIPSDLITDEKSEVESDKLRMEKTSEEIRRVEEVARREETIFTQITVLKDVSSNVQSSVIESNYSSATTESSESGIGTDKSIDSPSDSQASKECDDDSSLSLSVSVCSMDVQSSQKSPILKQPKTLRFPPKSLVKTEKDKRTSSTDTSSTVTICLWENCNRELDSDTDLLEHLQMDHVETQAGRENYTCQWQACKVKGKPSCSRLWLERHALSHGGNKPFKCIVDGCGKRFSTQILLERHVNHHFNEQAPGSNTSKKSADSAPKLFRRNGKKLRYRRQPWSARMFDFFDAGTMEGLAWRLGRITRWRLGGSCPLREPQGAHTLTLHAVLTATRYNAVEERREALVSYYPPHILEDEWVPEREVRRTRRVELSALPAPAKVLVYEQFCASYRKSPSPPPPAPTPAPAVARPAPRLLPARHCTSSRLLNNLIAKQKNVEPKEDCPANNLPIIYKEEEKVEVSGAKKRKMGRRHGGNAFWPCGR